MSSVGPVLGPRLVGGGPERGKGGPKVAPETPRGSAKVILGGRNSEGPLLDQYRDHGWWAQGGPERGKEGPKVAPETPRGAAEDRRQVSKQKKRACQKSGSDRGS